MKPALKGNTWHTYGPYGLYPTTVSLTHSFFVQAFYTVKVRSIQRSKAVDSGYI